MTVIVYDGRYLAADRMGSVDFEQGRVVNTRPVTKLFIPKNMYVKDGRNKFARVLAFGISGCSSEIQMAYLKKLCEREHKFSLNHHLQEISDLSIDSIVDGLIITAVVRVSTYIRKIIEISVDTIFGLFTIIGDRSKIVCTEREISTTGSGMFIAETYLMMYDVNAMDAIVMTSALEQSVGFGVDYIDLEDKDLQIKSHITDKEWSREFATKKLMSAKTRSLEEIDRMRSVLGTREEFIEYHQTKEEFEDYARKKYNWGVPQD